MGDISKFKHMFFVVGGLHGCYLTHTWCIV
jgi:hypothetical protein